MPWNDNKGGGGGWNPGGGGRGPWGQGPSNGGGGRQGPNMRPPDLDEVFKRGRDWLKQMFPNQAPGGVAGTLLGGLLLLLWVWTGVYIIPPAEQGVVLRFGAYVQTIGSGFHIRMPQPIETVERVNVGETRQINVGFKVEGEGANSTQVELPRESMMLTGDENIMHVDFTIQWQVKSALDYLFEVQDVENTVRAVAESAMREFVGQTPVDQIMTVNRGKIEQAVQATTQRVLDRYKAGVSILSVSLQTTQAPQDVIDAFNDVQAASADRDRKVNEAQKYANTLVPRAKGDAAKIEQDAQAYKEQAITLAKGEAQRFLSVLGQYKSAPQVTRQRMYVETMQRILTRTNKVILDSGKGGVMPYLPLPGLGLRPSQPPSNNTAAPPAAAGGTQ
jgi:membrane protease subunit HflK